MGGADTFEHSITVRVVGFQTFKTNLIVRVVATLGRMCFVQLFYEGPCWAMIRSAFRPR